MYPKILLFLCLLSLAVPAFAQGTNSNVSRLTVTCDNGAVFNNGVEIMVVHMRAGYTYTATAVGIDGFDPVLAVLDPRTGEGLCSDDENSASDYAANLPSSGRVRASDTSAQVVFNQGSSEEFADISLVVGGFDNATGEFLVFLEGMSFTDSDGAGDIFSVNVTPAMIDSGVPITTYMMTAAGSQLDPLVYQTQGGMSTDVLTDSDGNDIYCDDAGDSTSCYDTGTPLDGYSIDIGSTTLPSWEFDAMLTANLEGTRLNRDRANNYITYFMTSYQNKTEGEYVVVFHIGID